MDLPAPTWVRMPISFSCCKSRVAVVLEVSKKERQNTTGWE
jgi:hypothetical protein